ncbi:hypothetical protein ACFWIO_34120 [Streptomyces diastatochromogenes]|uniref:hypothetical protein n=1 Tax=Streptomyces diastatochromogenes TaxID=42236 RepID=UPI003649FD06
MPEGAEQATPETEIPQGGRTAPTAAAETAALPATRAYATAPTGPTHDPHEVTVQLDAVQLGDVRMSPVAGGGPRDSGRDGSDGPVFVDASGRRSRRFRRLGLLVAGACAGYAVVIVATLLSGSSDAPWLPVPGQDDDRPARQVDSSPLPSASKAATPSATGQALPPTARSTSVPLTSPGATAPAATKPTAGTSSAPGTAGGTKKSPSAPASSAAPSPDPSPTSGSTTSAPSPSPSGSTRIPGGRHRHPRPTFTL